MTWAEATPLIVLGAHVLGFIIALGFWWRYESTHGDTGPEWVWACVLWEPFLVVCAGYALAWLVTPWRKR